MLSLVEKAEEAAKQNDTEYMMKRLMQNKFDFNDFLNQYKMMNSMGTMGQVMKMIPGMATFSSCACIHVRNLLATGQQSSRGSLCGSRGFRGEQRHLLSPDRVFCLIML